MGPRSYCPFLNENTIFQKEESLMKIRLFLAALCLFLLPLFFEHSSNNSPFQFSASASGWVISGGRQASCECDPNLEEYHPDCVCGESITNPESNTSSGLGTESLLVLAALMLWLRLKA